MVLLTEGKNGKGFLHMDQRKLAVVMISLFSAWMLSFPFQGQVLHALANSFLIDVNTMIFGPVAASLAGLFFCGFLIKTTRVARQLMLFSIAFCLPASCVFFLNPSLVWHIALISISFLAGACIAAWGFFYKSCSLTSERLQTAAEVLIYSNVLMILINVAAINLSPYAGLGLAVLMLAGSLPLALQLPVEAQAAPAGKNKKQVSVARPLSFLCLFIVVITINSGLMYQVINPAFAHHQWLVSWYWAVPYIAALYIMKNLPRRTNRAYILYVAIAMIGFAFISFMTVDRSAAGYLLVNTLMLGACGVYDLFWWSILGEMLDFHDNPARIFGTGLAANVAGVLLGGLIGHAIITSSIPNHNSSLLALAVVCVTLSILPPLHKYLAELLKEHAYLTEFIEMPPAGQDSMADSFACLELLTERESQIAALLLQGKTYRAIATELNLSENTVKTHVKNIYSKYEIQNRAQLINFMNNLTQ